MAKVVLPNSKGKSKEQVRVIKYFYDAGCIFSRMKDEEYDKLVASTVSKTDWKQKALDKIGVDISEVSEVEPIHFEGYYFDGNRNYAKCGKDLKWRSSAYQISWIFASSSQVYLYQNTINFDEDGKKEATEEWFFKDITNFSTSSDTVEKLVTVPAGCLGKLRGSTTQVKKNIETNKFALVVPGDKFYCSMEANDYTENAIKALKAKLREKKA